MDKLANEDHTHHITPDEIRVCRNNWWIRSNFVGSDTMPVRHRADFKRSIVYLATAQEPGGYSLLPKLAKLFLILVELARYDARTERRQQDRRQQDRGKVEVYQRYSVHLVEQIGQVQGNSTQEISITTQRLVLKDGTKMLCWTAALGTGRDRRRLGTPEYFEF